MNGLQLLCFGLTMLLFGAILGAAILNHVRRSHHAKQLPDQLYATLGGQIRIQKNQKLPNHDFAERVFDATGRVEVNFFTEGELQPFCTLTGREGRGAIAFFRPSGAVCFWAWNTDNSSVWKAGEVQACIANMFAQQEHRSQAETSTSSRFRTGVF